MKCFSTIASAILWATVMLLPAGAVSQDITSLSLIEDAAGMFNERGYLKSNSFSLDGNVVVNDFNGNLMYTQVLAYDKLTQAGFSRELKICYNGSVGHTVISGLNSWDSNCRRNSVNMPEWIISLNNIAIQTLNFENEVITWPTVGSPGDTIALDHSVAALINGYHNCYTYNNSDNASQYYGTINILMGDGSVSQYISITPGATSTTSTFLFGEYRTLSKDDQDKGFMYTDTVDGTISTYFKLFRSDGTTVLFKKHVPQWMTQCEADYARDIPLMFLPVSFADQSGHTFPVMYDSTSVCNYGRPLVTNAGGILFTWHELGFDALYRLTTSIKGNPKYYEIDFYAPRYDAQLPENPSRCGIVNRGYVATITDGMERTTSFSYEMYKRIGQHYGYCIACEDYDYNHGTFELLPFRINSITYPSGGDVAFKYLYTGDTYDVLTVDFGLDCFSSLINEFPCKVSDGSWFESLGRDPYFTNMVTSMTRSDDITVSKDSLIFWWTDVSQNNIIDITDRLYTERRTGNASLQLPTMRKSNFTYSYYSEKGPYSTLSRDRGWALKLLYREVLDNIDFAEMLQEHSYWNRTTLLMDSNATIHDGVRTEEQFEYQFDGSTDDEQVVNILKKSTKNDWNQRSETYFSNEYFAVNKYTPYYSNRLVDSTLFIKGTDTLLSKAATEYYDNSSTNGYPGQPAATKQYEFDDGIIVDSVVERFEYVKDYPFKPYINAALRMKMNPQGDSTVFHYHDLFLINTGYDKVDDESDTIVNPVTMFEYCLDGSVDTVETTIPNNNNQAWYKAVQYVGRDSLVTYQSSQRGLLLSYIGPNKYVWDMCYDTLDRIDRIIAPGDFAYDDWWDISVTETEVAADTFDADYYFSSGYTYCDADTVVAGRVFYDIPDPLPSTNSTDTIDAAFRFGRFECEDDYFPVSLDSAFLIVDCKTAVIDEFFGTGNLAIYSANPICSYHSVSGDALSRLVTVTHAGIWRLNVTDIVKAWLLPGSTVPRGIRLHATLSYQQFVFYSGNHPDETKHPKMQLYFHGLADVDSLYTMRFNYDDHLTDGDDVSITTLVKPDNARYSRTNTIWFDGFNRPYQRDVVDSNGTFNRTLTGHDYWDRPITRTDELNYVTSTSYDNLDRVTGVTYPGTGSPHTHATYFAANGAAFGLDTLLTMYNLSLYGTRFIDENGHYADSYTDILGRLRLEVKSDGTNELRTYYDYDDLGNLTTVIRPNGDSVNYRYNSLGQLTKEWAADYDTIFYQYDKVGRLIRKKDGNLASQDGANASNWQFMDYDALGRVTTGGQLTLDGTDTSSIKNVQEFYYDQYSTALSRGKLSVALSNENGYSYGEEYDYDERGRLARQKNVFGAMLDSTTYDSIYVLRQGETGVDSVSFVVQGSDYINDTFVVRLLNDGWDGGETTYAFIPVYQVVWYTLRIPESVYCPNPSYAEIWRNTTLKNRIDCASSDHDIRGAFTASPGDSVTIITYTHLPDGVYVGAYADFTYYDMSYNVTYQLKRDWNWTEGTYLVLYQDDTPIDSLYYSPSIGTIRETINGGLFCDSGSVIKIKGNIAANDTTSYLFGMAKFDKYDRYQKYLTKKDLLSREHILEYTYNRADQLSSITYPDGSVVTYDYDDRGRLKSVGDSLNPTRYASISYTARNEIGAMVLGNNLQTVNYAYNERGWLNSINNGTSVAAVPGDLFGENLYYYGCDHPYATDWAAEYNGNVMGQKISFGGSDSAYYHYLYDDVDRLTETDIIGDGLSDSPLEVFGYDKNGNRVAYGNTGVSSTGIRYYYYDEGSNRLANIEGVMYDSLDNAFDYDANGNVTWDSTKNAYFYYDLYGQLDTIKFPNDLGQDYIAYGYNTNGERISKKYLYYYRQLCSDPQTSGTTGRQSVTDVTTSGSDQITIEGKPVKEWCTYTDETETRYVMGKGKVLAEYIYDLSYWLNRKYIYAGDQRIAMIDRNGTVYFYLNDHLGSARMLVAENGTVMDVYSRYWAFGETRQESVSSGQPNRYTGKPFDDDGGIDIYYYGARYYDAVLGRFLAVDPAASMYPGWSPYAYCANNPMKYVDPNGRWLEPNHNEILDAAFSKELNNDQLSILKQASVDVDKDQSSGGSYKHAMRSGNQTAEDASASFDKFLQDKMLEFADGEGDAALYALGEGMHAIADQTCPTHEGFQAWQGWGGPAGSALHATQDVSYVAYVKVPTKDYKARVNKAATELKKYYQKAIELRQYRQLQKRGEKTYNETYDASNN